MKVTYLPLLILTALAWCSESYQRLVGKRIQGQLKFLTPPMLSVARQSYAFTGTKARELLGYHPIFTVDEGLQKTITEHFKAT